MKSDGDDAETSPTATASVSDALTDVDNSNNIWSSLSLEEWQTQNRPSAEKDLIEITKDLFIKAKKTSAESIEIVKAGENYIQNRL